MYSTIRSAGNDYLFVNLWTIRVAHTQLLCYIIRIQINVIGEQEIKLPHHFIDWEGSVRRGLQSKEETDWPIRCHQNHQEERQAIERYQGHARINNHPQKAKTPQHCRPARLLLNQL